MKAKHHIEDQDWELIAKSIYDQRTETSAEEQSVSEILLPDEKEREQILEVSRQVNLYFDQKKYQANHAWEKIESRIHQNSWQKRTFIYKVISNPIYRVAAAILFAALLLVSGYEFFSNYSASSKLLEVSATHQVINKFALPDGTLVSMNSDTKLTYPKYFGSKTREVNLSGEAFFEVKPNKEKPFIIQAGHAQIKVLGTSFNVNAYPATNSVEVIVETGKVQFLNKTTKTKETDELILSPGDKGTLAYSSNALLKTTNADPNFLAWETRILIFKATSLDEVIVNLEKVNIRLADTRLNKLLLTAQFNDYSLDFILKVIETTFQIETQKVDGQYILKLRS